MKEQVSTVKMNDSGKAEIASEYSIIPFAINDNDSNVFNLFYYFLNCLIVSDISPITENIQKLNNAFNELLSKLTTEEDVQEMQEFLRDAAKLGGYAVKFQNSVEKILEDKMQEYNLKKISSDPISKHGKTETGGSYIESDYYSIKYRPFVDFSLNTKSSSFLTYLSIADAYRSNSSKDTLLLKFYGLLGACKTEEDINNLDKFLKETVSLGGYSITFYNEIKNKLNLNSAQTAFLHEGVLNKKIEYDKSKPVTSQVNENGKLVLKSPYTSVKINHSLGIKFTAQFIYFRNIIMQADNSRTENELQNFDVIFNKTLSMCEDINKVQIFNKYFQNLSYQGGIAYILYKKYENKIVLQDRAKIEEFESGYSTNFTEYYDTQKKKIESIIVEDGYTEDSVDEIHRIYKAIMTEIDEVADKTHNEEELGSLGLCELETLENIRVIQILTEFLEEKRNADRIYQSVRDENVYDSDYLAQILNKYYRLQEQIEMLGDKINRQQSIKLFEDLEFKVSQIKKLSSITERF